MAEQTYWPRQWKPHEGRQYAMPQYWTVALL